MINNLQKCHAPESTEKTEELSQIGEKWGGVKPNAMQTKCIGCLENKPKDISGKTSEIK